MPQALLAIVPLITAGVGLGTTLSGLGGGPSTPPTAPPATAAQNIAAEIAKRRNEGSIVANQDPNVVANTSGSLPGLSDQTFASQEAGLPGAFGQGGIDLSSIFSFLGGGNSGPSTNLYSLASTGAIA